MPRPPAFAEDRLRRGVVRARPAGLANPALASGKVELLARELQILSRSETPPFHHDEATNEELR